MPQGRGKTNQYLDAIHITHSVSYSYLCIDFNWFATAMLSIDRILWPTDFSTGAACAFPHAILLADWHDADLHILNVAEGRGKAGRQMNDQFPVPDRRLTDLLDHENSSLVDLDAVSITQHQVDAGSPAQAIVSYAGESDIDLVVAGTHGRRGLQRLLLGSVAEEVLRTAPCPVLTVRTGEDRSGAGAVRNILAPVDFSEASEVAVQHAKELALTYGSQITLLHAVEEVMYPSVYGVEIADIPGPKVVDRVEGSLAAMARQEIGYEHVVVDSDLGYAPSVILDYEEEYRVDLIVIATHGRSGLERLLLGSVTERVVRRATAPVFVVKSYEKSLLPTSASTTHNG